MDVHAVGGGLEGGAHVGGGVVDVVVRVANRQASERVGRGGGVVSGEGGGPGVVRVDGLT